MSKGDKLIKPAKGRILVSEPVLDDYYFERSVVFLAEHDEEGSFGLIINKPLELAFNDAIKDFPPINSKLFLGGPVNTDNLFVLHKRGNEIPGSSEIVDGVFWGGDMEKIRELIIYKELPVDDIRFFLGFSSWHPGQLEKELDEKSWIVDKLDENYLFDEDPHAIWRKHIKQLGADYAIWANFPKDPMLN